MVFGIVKKAMGIRRLPEGAPRGFQVSLSAAVAWAARETRLHQPDKETLEVNLKLDGRPFFGRCKIFLLLPGLHNRSHTFSQVMLHNITFMFSLNKPPGTKTRSVPHISWYCLVIIKVSLIDIL